MPFKNGPNLIPSSLRLELYPTVGPEVCSADLEADRARSGRRASGAAGGPRRAAPPGAGADAEGGGGAGPPRVSEGTVRVGCLGLRVVHVDFP